MEAKQISNNYSNNSNLFILQIKSNLSKKLQTWEFQSTPLDSRGAHLPRMCYLLVCAHAVEEKTHVIRCYMHRAVLWAVYLIINLAEKRKQRKEGKSLSPSASD